MRFPIAGVLVLAGCGRYADFALTRPEAGAEPRAWEWIPRPDPVIERGRYADVLNPSVIRNGPAYLNLISGWDGTAWHTLLAVSEDGVNWTEPERVLSPEPGGYIAANGHVLPVGDQLHYWYHAGRRERPRIELARSADGRGWRRETKPVLEPGPRGSWDERGVADPYVIRAGDFFYLYFLGQDRARRQRLGVARSSDGVGWEKHRSNPILELGDDAAFDENGLGEPAVWASHGRYWMLYTGRDRKENRRLGLAKSADGIRWERTSQVFAGAEPWNNKVLCDPTVLVEGGRVRVWFGGGDVPRPDENIHGKVGAAELRPKP